MKIKDLHLVAFYVQKPRAGVQTQIAGWMKNPDNFQYDERVEFTKGLSNKDQQYAGVILNLSKKTVVQNRYNKEQKDFDSLFKYFLEAYPQYVIQTMAQLDMAYLEQFIPKEEEAVAKELQDLHGMSEDEAKAMIAEVKETEPKKKSKKSKTDEETKAE
jgi:hypothetical protein